MFGKRQRASNAVTVIAAGTVVEGTLRVRGVVQIDGRIEGALIAEGHVSVGPEGAVVGDVTGDDLSIGGCVEGTLHAQKHLHVLSSGVVRGDARYTTLEVDRGGVMDGRTSRLDESAEAPVNDAEIVAHAAAE